MQQAWFESPVVRRQFQGFLRCEFERLAGDDLAQEFTRLCQFPGAKPDASRTVGSTSQAWARPRFFVRLA